MAYIVSPTGATDSVPDDWLERLIRQGFRPATGDEIAAWYASQELPNPYTPLPLAPSKPARKRVSRSTNGD